MLVENTEAAPAPANESKISFFRQSGWMLMAATGSGLLMWAVHKFASQMPKTEYGAFMALLQALNMMVIPAMGLQVTFAQQVVSAVTDADRRQLVGTVRGVIKGAAWLWLLLATLVFAFRDYFITDYKISNPTAIWMTLVAAFFSVCLPVFSGLLQGRLDFLWLGWTALLNGLGRLMAVAVLVAALGGYAAAGINGVLIGVGLALGAAAWQSRDIWRGPAEPIQWKPWVARVIPLSLGYGAATLMLSWDMIVVRRFFPEESTGFYGAAGMIGRALVFLTAPLTLVMFPRIVQSAARAEKTDVMAQALGATALVGGLGALSCTFLPELPLRIMYDESYLKVAPLVPWFAWGMLPLTLANVLLNNLLARRQFAVVPWLGVVALAYAGVLWFYHRSFEQIVMTLGLFGFLSFAVCVWFTWRGAKR